MKKLFFCCVLSFALAGVASAQSGTNSPYSQYGLGVLADQSQGFSRGMNGAGLGLRRGNVVNTLNPASYSAIDSLTMIFDMGVSGQVTNFKEGPVKVNARNTNFDYVVGCFRLFPKVGVAFGLLPFSNMGYKYTSSKYLDSTNGTLTETYSGDGGLHQFFVGAGWQLSRQLSVGANVSYLWGSLNHGMTTSSTTYINSLERSYSVQVTNYTADLGVQWEQKLNKDDALTVGATVGIGHKLGADPSCMVINVSSKDTVTHTLTNGLSIPMKFALGAAWTKGRQWVVDADLSMENWGALDFPELTSDGQYAMRSGILKNRYQIRAGADFVPNFMDRKFLKRVHYRWGVGYATPYYNINGKNGPTELSVSAGFGIPLQNSYNNRSQLNVSAQFVRVSAKDMIRENTFRLNIGLTFNERWFAKWKID